VSASAFIRGHAVTWDGSSWRHADDQSLAPGWGGNERPCPTCHLVSYDVDACLGRLPDCESACCGHGVQEGWISRPEAGVVFRGWITRGGLTERNES
jgi:hypothetical protein